MLTGEKRREILARTDELEPIINKNIEEMIRILKRLNEDGQKLAKINLDLQEPVKKIQEIMESVDPKDPENSVIRERMLTIMAKINSTKKHADGLKELGL